MALHLSCFFPLFLLPRHLPLLKKYVGEKEEEGGALMAQEGGSGVEGVAYWDLRGGNNLSFRLFSAPSGLFHPAQTARFRFEV